MRWIHTTGALGLLAGLASAQITFTEIATIDLDSTANPANPEYIGTNPSAIAYDGFTLTVAGFNGSGVAGEAAIVRVLDPLGTAVITPRFGVIPTPSLRGYSGLDANGTAGVAAAYDDGGVNPQGIAYYDSSGSQVWAKAGRGACGVAIDPGFPGGGGNGVGWTTFGVGRRILQAIPDGVDIFTDATGMVIFTSEGTFWRDMDFDDATGNIWLREGNNVISWQRTGDNALASSAIVFDPVDADFVNGQNLAYLAGLNAVIFNDRPAPTGGVDFFSVVKVIQEDGTPVTVDWGTFAPGPGAAYYDFSWHAPTGTLALLDFTNRNAHLFRIEGVGTPYCTATANSTGFPAGISGIGSDSVAANDLTLLTQPLPTQPGIYFFGPNQTQLPFGNGFRCVGGQVVRLTPQVPVAGLASRTLDLPTLGIVPGSVNFQFWFRDPLGGGASFNLSNGLNVVFVP